MVVDVCHDTYSFTKIDLGFILINGDLLFCALRVVLERAPSLDKDLIGLWEWLTLCADCCFGANSKLG